MLLSEARVPGAAFIIAIIGAMCAAGAWQDGNQLQEQLPTHLPQHRAAFSLSLRVRRDKAERGRDMLAAALYHSHETAHPQFC